MLEQDGKSTGVQVIARATRPGPNHGRFFKRCNDCEAFDWLTDADGDFMEPDFE